MRRHSWKIAGICLALLAAASLVHAAVRSGKVASVDADSKSITVTTSDGKDVEFEIRDGVSITLNGKKAGLDQIEAGQQISVTTGKDDKVQKVAARLAPTKPATPKPSKSKKSKSKSSDDEPAASGEGTDWPQFGGIRRDNKSTETGLLKRWPTKGPKLLWTANGLGAGYGSVSIANGVIYALGNVGDQEMLVAIDLDTGRKQWSTPFARASKLQMGDGPRGTPTVDGEMVYGLGGNGDLICAEVKGGDVRWKKNILSEFGGENIKWGISESVLIDGNRLICTPGGKQATIAALDKQSGDTLWKSQVRGGSQAGYASAIVADVGGVRQYIQFLAAGTAGVRAEDGVFLWGDSSSANGTANCSTPLFVNDMVFTASGYGTGGALLRLTTKGEKTDSKLLYTAKEMKNHHGDMVIVDGFLYGSSDPGILTCMDVKKGDVRWTSRSPGKGSLIYADGHLYVRSEEGPIALVQANPSACNEHGLFDQPDRSGSKAWSHLAIAHGKLFVRDQDTLLCYSIKAE
jgi:outer membrane protein assembly factor BamB